MTRSQVNISIRQTVIILWRLGDDWADFCGVFSFHKTNWVIREALGSTIRPKRRKNTGAQIPVAVSSSSLRVSYTVATMSGVFPRPHHRLLSLFRHRTFPRLRQLARAVMCVPAENIFLGGRTYCERKTINPSSTRVNTIILFTTTLVLSENSCSIR